MVGNMHHSKFDKAHMHCDKRELEAYLTS